MATAKSSVRFEVHVENETVYSGTTSGDTTAGELLDTLNTLDAFKVGLIELRTSEDPLTTSARLYDLAPDGGTLVLTGIPCVPGEEEGAPPVEVSFFVVNLDGRSKVLNSSPNASFLSVKEQIFAKTAVPLDAQYLVYQGKVIENQDTLTSKQITKDAVIWMAPHLPGGMPWAWQNDDKKNNSWKGSGKGKHRSNWGGGGFQQRKGAMEELLDASNQVYQFQELVRCSVNGSNPFGASSSSSSSGTWVPCGDGRSGSRSPRSTPASERLIKRFVERLDQQDRRAESAQNERFDQLVDRLVGLDDAGAAGQQQQQQQQLRGNNPAPAPVVDEGAIASAVAAAIAPAMHNLQASFEAVAGSGTPRGAGPHSRTPPGRAGHAGGDPGAAFFGSGSDGGSPPGGGGDPAGGGGGSGGRGGMRSFPGDPASGVRRRMHGRTPAAGRMVSPLVMSAMMQHCMIGNVATPQNPMDIQVLYNRLRGLKDIRGWKQVAKLRCNLSEQETSAIGTAAEAFSLVWHSAPADFR